jgi:hypothetical protein
MKAHHFSTVQMMLSAGQFYHDTNSSILGTWHSEMTEASDNICTVSVTQPGWGLRGTDYTEETGRPQSTETPAMAERTK